MSDPTKESRNLQLDAMRGIAAVGVMLYHFTDWFGRGKIDGIALIRDFETNPVFSFSLGAKGVELFFMISGFVLPVSAARHKTIISFVTGRFIRLYPAYWVAVIFASIAYHASGSLLPNQSSYLAETFVNLSMFQHLFGVVDINGVFWTLYVELQFYFLLVLVMCFSMQSRLVWLTLGISGIHLMFSLIDGYDWIPGVWRLQKNLPLLQHLQYFTFGIALSEVSRSSKRIDTSSKIAAIIAAALLFAGNCDEPAVLVIALVFSLACFKKIKPLENHFLIWFGTISYSLYLFHPPIGYSILNHCQGYLHINYLVIFSSLASILFAAIVCFSIELPSYSKLRSWQASGKS